MNKKPMLQIALDNLTIEQAIEDAKKVEQYIDLIEVGTILITSCGKKAVKKLAQAFPNKIIVADAKIADAAQVFSTMMFENNANYITCICAAEIATIKKALTIAKKFHFHNDVQIELTSCFTFEQAQQWKAIGIEQVVYHRSRDSQANGANWSKADLDKIEKLCNMGFKVTVTGGIEVKDIELFKHLPIYIFIAGRSLRDADDALAVAKSFQEQFSRYWS